MRFAYLTASTAALLLSSTALMAQEANTSGGAMGGMDFSQSVFVDVDGAAYLVPIDLAAELCASDAATLTQTAQSAFDASGMDPAMMQGGATGTAAAGAGTDASGAASATGTASAGAATTGTTGTSTDMATADAGAATGAQAGNTGAAGMGSDTQTAQANTTTGTGGTSGDVQNVQTTAADTTAGAAGGQNFTEAGEEYLALVVCQIDAASANATGSTFAPATDADETE